MELVVKNSPANAGETRDAGSIPESERSPGRWHGNPFQYSCLENSMDRGAWWVIVPGPQELNKTEPHSPTPTTHTNKSKKTRISDSFMKLSCDSTFSWIFHLPFPKAFETSGLRFILVQNDIPLKWITSGISPFLLPFFMLKGGPIKNMSTFQCPNPVNVILVGKRVFADVIKLRTSRWIIWIICVLC